MCELKGKGFDAQFCVKINETPTEFVLQRFVNKWLLIITQYEKICNVFSVEFERKQNDGTIGCLPVDLENPTIPITITNTFGTDTDEARSAIQFLVNNTSLCKCPSELVVSIGLKEINGDVLRKISKVLNEVIEVK